MSATLNAATAAHYELVWTGSDRIVINGYGQVIFSQLTVNGAATLEQFVDSNGSPLYVKKKAVKAQGPAAK